MVVVVVGAPEELEVVGQHERERHVVERLLGRHARCARARRRRVRQRVRRPVQVAPQAVLAADLERARHVVELRAPAKNVNAEHN